MVGDVGSKCWIGKNPYIYAPVLNYLILRFIPEKQLGTAYALIFWVQNWGLMGVPLLIGWALDKSNPAVLAAKEAGTEVPPYDYTLPMMIFAATGLLAIIVALMLKAEDKRKAYGLELPNIQK